MPRSFTKSQIDRLGDRLRHAPYPSMEDLERLQALRLEYDPSLQEVEQALRDRLGLSATSRLKTVGTIIDKLKRERTIRYGLPPDDPTKRIGQATVSDLVLALAEQSSTYAAIEALEVEMEQAWRRAASPERVAEIRTIRGEARRLLDESRERFRGFAS